MKNYKNYNTIYLSPLFIHTSKLIKVSIFQIFVKKNELNSVKLASSLMYYLL